MSAFVTMLALAAGLCVLQEALRRCGPWLAVGLYLVAPAVLTPFWLRTNDLDPFLWIKVYTILACICFGTALRHTALIDRSWARVAVTALLTVNILEAVALDVLGAGLPHALNAAAGVVLVLALPREPDAVQIAPDRRGVHHYGTPRLWIVGYTVWNWTFVYLNYPEFTGHHVVVLLSAFMPGMIDPRRWLQTRAYTLGVYFIALLTFGPQLSWLDTSHWSNPLVGACAAVVSLLIALGCALQLRTAAARVVA